MKKQFEMSQDEHDELMAIVHEVIDNGGIKTPAMKDKADEIFKRMGKKYGFIWYTAEPPTGDNRKQFMAEAIEIKP